MLQKVSVLQCSMLLHNITESISCTKRKYLPQMYPIEPHCKPDPDHDSHLTLEGRMQLSWVKYAPQEAHFHFPVSLFYLTWRPNWSIFDSVEPLSTLLSQMRVEVGTGLTVHAHQFNPTSSLQSCIHGPASGTPAYYRMHTYVTKHLLPQTSNVPQEGIRRNINHGRPMDCTVQQSQGSA